MRKNILKTNSIEVKTYFKEIYPSEMLCVTFQYKHLNEHWKKKRETMKHFYNKFKQSRNSIQ